MNTNANARDYLVQFTQRQLISTVNSIQLQSASLVHLTQAINQLTRTSTVSAPPLVPRLQRLDVLTHTETSR